MNQSELKKFAQNTRRKLLKQIGNRLDYILNHDDPYLRAHAKEKAKIKGLLDKKGKEQLVEETAYIWFNRLTALRFMDNRGYNRILIVSPLEEESQPNILSEIKQGKFPEEISGVRHSVYDYIDGKIDTNDPDREAYKITLLAWCNYLGTAMPYLFEKIDDWAALLLPLDLLSEESIVTDIQKGIQKEDCKDVEVIGWLYQYYISEKKDEVFAGLKKNKKITKENIPAATQLFTPEWIVRYMVENSLGRLWLNNFPGSSLKGSMEYFVEGDKEKDILRVSDPVEIKVMDPSCGSGHILVYAFDILYKIYEEEGYTITDIPSLILKNNLFGVDIDDRAAALSSFALAMKARDKDRAFFEKGIVPNVIASQEVDVNSGDVKGITFSQELSNSFNYLKEAKNLGSLIPVTDGIVNEIAALQENAESISFNDFFEKDKIEQLKTGLKQLEYLSPRYHCVITNPPYMSSKGMSKEIKDFVAKEYKDYKNDLFAVSIINYLNLLIPKGFMGAVTPYLWMFILSYQKMREKILKESTIITLIQLEYNAFAPACVPVATYILKSQNQIDYKGGYIKLSDFKGSENQSPKTLEAIKNNNCGWYFSTIASGFSKIPGSPIAYWLKKPNLFLNKTLSDSFFSGGRLKTHNNKKYIRKIWEISKNGISDQSWRFLANGGDFRKWYGNNTDIVHYLLENTEYYKSKGGLPNSRFSNQEGLCWGDITSSSTGFRYMKRNEINTSVNPSIFPYDNTTLSLLNSTVADYFLKIITPTLHSLVGDILRIPLIQISIDQNTINSNIQISKTDWDLRETSWDFLRSPLLTDYSSKPIKNNIDNNLIDISWASGLRKIKSIKDSYNLFTEFWSTQFKTLHKNEEELNRIFIDLYELQDELISDVPYNKITILRNELEPSYLKINKILFKKNEIFRQFISYAVGCIFGRYSIDKDGLVLANTGDGIDEYLNQISEPSFMPDKSGILPITDENDFTDDLPSQFKTFLKTSFGQEHFQENIRFIEEAIGKDIRSYLIKDFYKDHVKRYKKRPIYWMISSPSGAFRALIYLHRYTKDTIGVFLNDYLRQYKEKLYAKIKLAEQTIISGSASSSDKTTAQKDIDKIHKVLKELETWERDIVYPLALKRVELDLDDGVKVNYGKLGDVLEVVKGLNG